MAVLLPAHRLRRGEAALLRHVEGRGLDHGVSCRFAQQIVPRRDALPVVADPGNADGVAVYPGIKLQVAGAVVRPVHRVHGDVGDLIPRRLGAARGGRDVVQRVHEADAAHAAGGHQAGADQHRAVQRSGRVGAGDGVEDVVLPVRAHDLVVVAQGQAVRQLEGADRAVVARELEGHRLVLRVVGHQLRVRIGGIGIGIAGRIDALGGAGVL